MDENLSRGYVQLGKTRAMNDIQLNNGFNHPSPPVDKYNFIYFALVLAGVSFLMPYNSFMMAVDYFKVRYPDTTVVFDMSVVYVTMAFCAVIANNFLVETVSLNRRITFGYFVSITMLNFVVISEIRWELFEETTSYTINLVAVGLVAVGSTVQQSSFYGYTSMLPSRYTQAVMAGESAAGFWVAVDRILTKSLVHDERHNTSMFFSLSVMTIGMCWIFQWIMRKSEFVQFYVNLCQERNRIILEPTEDVGLMDPLDQTVDPSKGQYGVLKIQTSPLGAEAASGSIGGSASDVANDTGQCSGFSFSNPVYEPTATTTSVLGGNGPTYKVEDVVVMQGTYYRSQSNKPWANIKRGMMSRYEVAKLIFPYMASIAVAYFVTLCLYPGILSEIISCTFESWMPVILMASFNGADLLGKVLASIPYEWTRSQLLYFSGARAILIPLFLLCAIPRRAPFLPGEGYPLMFSWLLGLTNGIVGSVPMIQAPSKVPEQQRELAGNIMTLSYTMGLTLGSTVAYMLDSCLGPVVQIKDVCKNLSKPVSNVIANITGSEVMTNTVKVAVEAITMRIPILDTTTITTTTTAALTSVLTTAALSNVTSSPLSIIGGAIVNNATVTSTLPKIIANASTTITNSILQH